VDVFVSYARAHAVAVDRLTEDIQLGDHEVWFDRDLRGGEAWWVRILERIRACSVFVFAVAAFTALASLSGRVDGGHFRDALQPLDG
jgi:hypothetical protein